MSKILYLNTFEAPEAPKIVRLSSYIPPVRDTDSCSDALERFFDENTLFAVPIVDRNERPVGLIERHNFVEFFGRPFTREIHGKKRIGNMASSVINLNPIVIESSTTVDNVAQIILDAGVEHMASGFIVVEDGKYFGVANGHVLLNELTQRRQAELYALAHHDLLTGLPNRRLFLDRIKQGCLDAKRTDLLVAVMFIDVDRFKLINDSLGHAAGDHLLKAVADRLQQCARDCDTVARIGGDEFGIIMEGIRDASNANAIAGRIIESMATSIVVAGQEFFVTVSIGISIFPTDDSVVSGLLNKADAAMYAVKANGRNGFKYYVPGLSAVVQDSLSIETELRMAIARDQLILHYQPQVDLKTGQVSGVEALVRWLHPERGLLSPAHFIPVAEQSHLIVELGYWVLRAACRQFRSWADDGFPLLKISVNVSTRQFQQSDFCDGVRSILKETAMDTAYLELEMTESIMMRHGKTTLETLREIKAMGISLALDDFGTGFSSLSYLRQYPIDRLKIDQSFVRSIEKSSSGESIVRAISALAKSMAMEVIAEGVESNLELDVVRDCDCDGVQGYLFSKPVSADQLMHWLSVDRQVKKLAKS